MNQEIRYFINKMVDLPTVRWERFKTFKITFHLGSPICVTTPFLHLDAILSHLLLMDSLKDDFFILPRKLNISRYLPKNCRMIPVLKTGDIYHCSSAQFIPNNLHVDTIYKRFEEKWTENLKAKKIRIGSGHYRSYMMKQPYVSCQKVIFYARGEMNYCQRLIDGYMYGIGNDYRIGFGAIRKIEYEETPEDWSIVANGIAMRSIPVEMCSEWEDAAYLPFRSPYWEPKNVGLCVSPGSKCKLK